MRQGRNVSSATNNNKRAGQALLHAELPPPRLSFGCSRAPLSKRVELSRREASDLQGKWSRGLNTLHNLLDRNLQVRLFLDDGVIGTIRTEWINERGHKVRHHRARCERGSTDSRVPCERSGTGTCIIAVGGAPTQPRESS